MATALPLVVGGICVLGMIFSPQLVWLLASGFARVPGKFELAVTLTRIMFPFLLLVALAAQAMGILNAMNQFGIPALSSTFFNLGSVAFGLGFGYTVGRWMGHEPDHVDGLGRGGRRRRAMAVSMRPACTAPASATVRASTSRIPACAISCA